MKVGFARPARGCPTASIRCAVRRGSLAFGSSTRPAVGDPHRTSARHTMLGRPWPPRPARFAITGPVLAVPPMSGLECRIRSFDRVEAGRFVTRHALIFWAGMNRHQLASAHPATTAAGSVPIVRHVVQIGPTRPTYRPDLPLSPRRRTSSPPRPVAAAGRAAAALHDLVKPRPKLLWTIRSIQ